MRPTLAAVTAQSGRFERGGRLHPAFSSSRLSLSSDTALKPLDALLWLRLDGPERLSYPSQVKLGAACAQLVPFRLAKIDQLDHRFLAVAFDGKVSRTDQAELSVETSRPRSTADDRRRHASAEHPAAAPPRARLALFVSCALILAGMVSPVPPSRRLWPADRPPSAVPLPTAPAVHLGVHHKGLGCPAVSITRLRVFRNLLGLAIRRIPSPQGLL